MSWQAVVSSFGLVAASEMGDQTQWLAFALAGRFRRPWSVMLGILVAGTLNHALASTAGAWLSPHLHPRLLAGALAVTFLVFGVMALRGGGNEDRDTRASRFGPFLTTALLFLLAEVGDKTQFATIALAAHFHNAAAVTLGSTLGMVASDGLAVFVGGKLAHRLDGPWLRRVAAAFFFAFGCLSGWAALH